MCLLVTIKKALQHVNVKENQVRYIFANFYQSGENYCNGHSHKCTHQILISLGATRELFVDKEKWQMQSGDVASFGSQRHGVTKASASCGRAFLWPSLLILEFLFVFASNK